jgi:two-component system, OmpR family, response regulator RegX3
MLPQTFTVWPEDNLLARGDERWTLTPIELRREGQVVTIGELLAEVWQGRSSSTAVVKAVERLRAKLEEEPRSPQHLLWVRGEGFRLRRGIVREMTGAATADGSSHS